MENDQLSIYNLSKHIRNKFCYKALVPFQRECEVTQEEEETKTA